MAGAGYKLFATGDVLTAAQVNTYLMQQTVMVFASSAARTSALSGVLAEGMVSYLQDSNVLEVYDGSAWIGATGDITALTAGTGISITNPTGPIPTVAIDTAVTADLTTAQTLTNKTLTTPIIATITNTGTLTLPTSTDTLVGRATTDTLTNKTLTSPVISTITNTGTLTLPTSTDTIVGRATTDTLTNKTLTSPVLTTPSISNIDAKGDLLAGTADNTIGRLAVGANGTVLTADSAETTGLKWAAADGGAIALISSTTFSGSSAHNVNDVFSTTYQNYLIQINHDAPSATGYQQLRLRVSGADNTTSNYFWSGIYNISNATTPAGEGASAQTSFTYAYLESAATASCTFQIANPFETKATTYSNIMARTTGTQSLIYSNAGAFNTTTSFTGFTLYPASGTITGKVRVYGYNN